MKNITPVALLACTLLLSSAVCARESGFQIESFTDTKRTRPVLIDWWYPVDDAPASTFNYGLGTGRIAEAGAIAPGRFPLVMLSHGALGAARNYSWIAEALARQGFVVAGVSHFGESYVYGSDSIDPQAVLQHWERPEDVRVALDFILSESAFRESVNGQRVGFVGHSSGGATALQLAGVRTDSQRMSHYCNSPKAIKDRGCDYARNVPDTALSQIQTPAAMHDYRDSRLRAFVALDPALGPAFHDYSSVPPGLRVLLIASSNNDFLTFEHHASAIAARLPQAQKLWLDNGKGHFVYLNPCALDIDANGVALCQDRSGVDRVGVQRQLRSRIVAFFKESL